MKRKIVIISLITALIVTGCGAKEAVKKESGMPTIIEDTTTEKVTEAPKPTEAPVVQNNVFFNDTNNAYTPNTVDIRPGKMYWDNGVLVADCFVINGYEHAVYNIDVKKLTFKNDSGVFASGNFGVLQNLTIAPHSYVVWTFTFSRNAVMNPNADLTHTVYFESDVTNYY